MSRHGLIVAVFMLAAVLVGAVQAGDLKVNVNGQVRYRAFADDKYFGSTGVQTYSELRSRIGITAAPQDNLTLFVQLQDSRLVGSNSGGLSADTNVGLHQGFFDYVVGRGWSVKAGRFEMVYADERLLGSVGWHNVGRTWDAVRIRKETGRWFLDWFGAQLNETAFAENYPDKDKVFGGLTFHCKERNVEAFFWSDVNRTPGEGFVSRKDMRGTAGVYSARKFLDDFDYSCTAAYQFGQQKSTTVPDTSGISTTTDLDISALLFTLEIGYSFGGERKVRLAGLFDYASGDDDATDKTFKAFDNLYYTGHKFRGYMDYFVASNPLGLMDAALRSKFTVSDRWTISADAHVFMAAQEYADSTGASTTAVGNEIDLTAGFKDGRFGFTFGVSAFSAADQAYAYADVFEGGKTSTWSYAMCTADF